MKTLEDYATDIGIPVDALKGSHGRQEIAIARELYWWQLNQNGFKMTDIAAMFGRKSHSTISSGITNVKKLVSCNDSIAVPLLKAVDA